MGTKRAATASHCTTPKSAAQSTYTCPSLQTPKRHHGLLQTQRFTRRRARSSYDPRATELDLLSVQSNHSTLNAGVEHTSFTFGPFEGQGGHGGQAQRAWVQPRTGRAENATAMRAFVRYRERGRHFRKIARRFFFLDKKKVKDNHLSGLMLER